jgi:pyruvate dehydrogenase (quinone)
MRHSAAKQEHRSKRIVLDLPPHITLQRAKNFSLALMKGDPSETGVIKGSARQVLESILPGKE